MQIERKRLSAHILGEPFRESASKLLTSGSNLTLDEKLTVFKLVMLLNHPASREGAQLLRREPLKLSA